MHKAKYQVTQPRVESVTASVEQEVGGVECRGAATFVCLCAYVCKCNSLVDLFDTLNSVHT